MEELTVQKVNKWLFWMMIAFFTVMTYLNFYVIFHRIIQLLLSLPFWFFFTTAIVVTLFIIHFINQGEKEINLLAIELAKQQELLMEIERKYRLVKFDLNKISPHSFKYYCVDLLKMLGFHEVNVLITEGGVDIKVRDQDGVETYVKCALNSLGTLREQARKLHFKMFENGTKKGIIIINDTYSEIEKRWALNLGIECLDRNNLRQMTHSFIDFSTLIQ